MHIFDFFAEFTSTASRAWAMSHFAVPHQQRPKRKLPSKPVVHDLSFHLERAFFPFPSPPVLPVASTTAAPAHMPLELILLIIEASYDHRHPDISLLKACSLVSRDWSLSVQKLLFRRVTLQNQQAFDAFSWAVNPATERGAILGSAVRDLCVVVDYSQPAYLHQRAMGLAVSLCPNLQELDLSVYGQVGSPRLCRQAPAFDPETLDLLRSGPKITSLSFSNWSENQDCLFQLLDVWPSIRSLSMSGTSAHLPPQLPPFKASLEQLRINFQTPPSMEFMAWLLHHSVGSLRTATFERDPCPDLVHFIINSFASTLCSLSIPNCNSPDVTKNLQRCEKLRFIRMDQPQINPVVYKSLPASVSHLALGVDRDTPLQPVIDLVKTRSALELVTIRLWNGGDSHRLLPALKIACAYRGVELCLTKDTRLYRSMLVCDLLLGF
ncbi:hypothetical protein FA15DRAFT_636861 [Coprinopsis marcescibilis]|uniref:F-box domain-containing protein n=1 Tax=Coprinopsis marcescibilis TaxID=230819 RepID=A0A5C3L2J4_COPMA|nr:hypothetical protein FA15DRAFT_636861 [Coprinopsis marcescibilis]